MDVYSLLNIKLEVLQDFPLLANRVADHQVERVINRNASKLKQIEDRITVEKNLNVPQKSIEEVIRKVIRLARKKDYNSENWNFHELRIVSYYLMKLRNNQDYYRFALTLLDQNWKSLFFNGLIFYLMNSWHSMEPEYREMTCSLLVKKLRHYTDNNKRYLLLKDHLNFLEPSGPKRMAALIERKNMNLTDAPTILGFKSSSLQASYYSDVIIEYFKENEIDDLDVIENIFEIHNYDRTKKLTLANLVHLEDQRADGLRRSKLCRFINRILGDVSLTSTWAPFLGATTEEANLLRSAMKTVNIWFAQQIIETFFDICVQDKDRKNFWLNYVKDINSFKIVGSSIVKFQLKTNEKIGHLFLKHFIQTNSQSSFTSALVLFIRDKMLVEFSDTGALYVYNKGHEKVNLVRRKAGSIKSTNDLKTTSMNNLIQSDDWGGYLYYEEGRVAHSGYWQNRLAGWLDQMVLSSKNYYSSAAYELEEEIFKATPLEKEDTIEPDDFH